MNSEAQPLNNLTPMSLVETYVCARRSERGLTIKGEIWIRQTLPKFDIFIASTGKSLLDVKKDEIRQFLSSINGVWNRHSHFRAIRAFYNWLVGEGYIPVSPCYKMQAPKLPKKIMPRPTIGDVIKLLGCAISTRDKAIICLLSDTGFRLTEIAGILPQDIDWATQTVTVWGKGSKQRRGKFGDVTCQYLRKHISSYSPDGNIWGLKATGIAIMLKRLHKKTGIVLK